MHLKVNKSQILKIVQLETFFRLLLDLITGKYEKPSNVVLSVCYAPQKQYLVIKYDKGHKEVSVHIGALMSWQ